MKYTNKYHLPFIVVGAILSEQRIHKPIDGRIGVTTLMNPPLVFRLLQKHWDEVTMDVSDLMWAFEGSAIHAALDRFAKKLMAGVVPDYLMEQIRSLNMSPSQYDTEKWITTKIDGWTIRGVIDVYDKKNGFIEDYKRASTWSFVYKDRSLDSWTKQLNIYKYMLEKSGKPVEKLFINGFLRDWTESKVGSGNYPESNFQRVEIPVWSNDKIEEYLHERVALFKKSKTEDIPCTPEERWRSGGQFALMVPRRKTAKKLADSEEELIKYAERLGIAKYTIEKRKVMDRKCLKYCSVARFCPFNIYNKAGAANGKI